MDPNIDPEDIDQDLLREVHANRHRLPYKHWPKVILKQKRLQKTRKLEAKFRERIVNVFGNIKYIRWKSRKIKNRINSMEDCHNERAALVAEMEERTKTFRAKMQMLDFDLKDSIRLMHADFITIGDATEMMQEGMEKMEATCKKGTIHKAALGAAMQKRIEKIRAYIQRRDLRVKKCIDRGKAAIEQYQIKDEDGSEDSDDTNELSLYSF
ncbi:hypothetical protein KR074_007961 [Drosophila pseudoananassae]|nr:hypothetical protein KR074_007961 [Drosophila pseudoananassae]